MQMNSDIATALYYTGIGPFTKQSARVEKVSPGVRSPVADKTDHWGREDQGTC